MSFCGCHLKSAMFRVLQCHLIDVGDMTQEYVCLIGTDQNVIYFQHLMKHWQRKKLIEALLSDYNMYARPVRDPSQTIHVFIDLSMKQIVDVVSSRKITVWAVIIRYRFEDRNWRTITKFIYSASIRVLLMHDLTEVLFVHRNVYIISQSARTQTRCFNDWFIKRCRSCKQQ